MTLDNALGNEQTESHAPAIILGQLHEALKNRFQLIIGNAFSSVADATDNVVINVLEAYDDGALSGGELQCIAQKIADERARSDKALAMRDDFMGIVSHDLLNLLNAMVGISSLIEKEVAQASAGPATKHRSGESG